MSNCANIRCICLDVDGVLTDGGIYWNDAGAGMRRFHAHDGFALHWFQRLGGLLLICSGKRSAATTLRAQELAVDHVIQGSTDKLADVGAWLAGAGLTFAEVAAFGDDLPDVPLLRRCGLGVAVANAAAEVRAAAGLVTTRAGGHGAVREGVEHILRASGRWGRVLAHYGIEAADGAAS